jgi:hypothetical protein
MARQARPYNKPPSKFKIKCNQRLGRIARHYRRAIVLDSEWLLTSKTMVEAKVESIMVPQINPKTLAIMRKRIRDRVRRGSGWAGVQVSGTTMIRALRANRGALVRQNLLIWLDAMNTWNSAAATGSSVHADFCEMVDMFASGTAKRWTCALTTATRSKDTANQLELGDTKAVVLRDIIRAVDRHPGIHVDLVDQLAYPQMLFVIVELRRSGDAFVQPAPVVQPARPSGAREWRVGDRVRVAWKASKEWSAGVYSGVVTKIAGARYTVVYDKAGWNFQSADQLM